MIEVLRHIRGIEEEVDESVVGTGLLSAGGKVRESKERGVPCLQE